MINKKEQTSCSLFPKGNKGQLGNLQGIIMTVIIVGLLIGVGFLIFGSLKDTMGTTVNTVSNETWIPTGLAGSYLGHNSTGGDTCFNSGTIIQVVNKSGADNIIAPGNYTYSSVTGLFKNTSSSDLYLASWNVSYTYKSGGTGCQGVQDTETAFKNFNTFLPILIIIAIVGILLAIVFGVLGKGGGVGSGGRTAEV